MERLADRLAVLIMCIAAFSIGSSERQPVVGILLTVGAASAIEMFSGKKAAPFIIAGFSALCIFMPAFFCAAPMLLYLALWEKKKWSVLPCAGVLLDLEGIEPFQLMLSAVGIAVALIFYVRLSKLIDIIDKMTELRDMTAQRNMELDTMNRRLIDAQDNEIHLATLKERNRIAREIHDNVGHMLTRSLLQAGALMVINKDEKLKEPLSGLKETLDSAMTSIRKSVHDLHDDSVDLKSSVQECLKSAGDRFTAVLEYDVENDMPSRLRLCILGIVKEGVSNAVKHSSGDRLRVIIREHPGFYQLMIEDNGRSGPIKETGIGLKNMRERAQSAGGLLNIESSEKGFKIFMTVRKGEKSR
ncbi:MAG: sensor histidine kinase [Ruminococcus sp.]|nr:sensor histidine kinase [Ruminococcus sp.]